MSVERLRRVLWRLRSTKPGSDIFSNKTLERCIMMECGTDPKTYRNNRMALKKLSWVLVKNRTHVRLSGKDLVE